MATTPLSPPASSRSATDPGHSSDSDDGRSDSPADPEIDLPVVVAVRTSQTQHPPVIAADVMAARREDAAQMVDHLHRSVDEHEVIRGRAQAITRNHPVRRPDRSAIDTLAGKTPTNRAALTGPPARRVGQQPGAEEFRRCSSPSMAPSVAGSGPSEMRQDPGR